MGQNQNESLNAAMCERHSKTKYFSLTNLTLRTYDAVSNFNIGEKVWS